MDAGIDKDLPPGRFRADEPTSPWAHGGGFGQRRTPVVRSAAGLDVRDGLEGTYPQCEYCVEYRQTDFDFISRLMEQEGIYYFFEHADGRGPSPGDPL